jgi:hypothetical protein
MNSVNYQKNVVLQAFRNFQPVKVTPYIEHENMNEKITLITFIFGPFTVLVIQFVTETNQDIIHANVP